MRNGDEKNLQFQTDLQKLRYALELIPYHQAQTASWSSLYSADVSFNNPNLIYLPTEPHQILPTRSVQRTIERFQMTSRQPYRCSETIKRRPCWCSKPILWELICFLMSLSFVPINLHRYYSREWKRSIGNRLLARWRHLLLRPESFSFFFSCENFIPARFKWKIRNLHKKGKPWWTLVVVVNDVILQMAHSN